MSDLSELRRQRELLKGHLVWLDNEIAKEELRAKASPLSAPPLIRPQAPVDDRDAEAILSEYRRPEAAIATRTKLGCVLYFVVALALIAAAVAAFYLFTRGVRAGIR